MKMGGEGEGGGEKGVGRGEGGEERELGRRGRKREGGSWRGEEPHST